ncbi:HAD-superfamily subfamily IB hydrolase, TIGR01490 [Sulfurivirga caldicuralii]|uniref:Histidinol-phosphatase n=1 Tax=Sulfurivirga caldicuralii TaxID=364032 RepID=A0A1N6EWP8_9GAMM|nr:HAD family hydrolase [Sulfurivirga caldicuralii]SIN87387.1 HAD-superfamily subfamily IB hydrolase, TIGR01490 [Sulfurivirga caldicuralii]
MALAIFDLDNTLLGGDSDHLWGEFVIEKGLVDPADHRRQNDQFYADYCNGTLDIHAYQRFALAPLVGRDPEELAQWHREFMQRYIEPIILPKGFEALEKHRKAGDTLMIITATNAFVTRPIAERLGVEHLLATEPERDENGYYTGEIVGIPTFQHGKVERLQQWLNEHGETLEGSWFYSDSHNDIPLLEAVDNPAVVDPDDRLRAHAERQGWPIISFR